MEIEVADAPERMRYEARVEGAVAGFVQYSRSGNQVVFLHTKVDDAYGGKGIGGRLARGALDDVRSRGLLVVARCPFISGWIERHTEYADLLSESDSTGTH